MDGSIRIGTSGWQYDSWRGSFYPPGLHRHQELDYASHRFNSIEINGSFYSLQRPSTYRRWHDATPDDFVFSLKGSRYLTHVLRLDHSKDRTRQALANFIASGVLELRQKLGVILWQLPPNLHFDPLRISRFLSHLPQTSNAAAELASEHEPWMQDRASLGFEPRLRIRHAIEVRHPSFIHEDFFALLREHRVAAVFAESSTGWPEVETLTADFAYIRFHGPLGKYAGRYPDSTLQHWAGRIRHWVRPERSSHRRARDRSAIDVFAYFNNDIAGNAPRDALRLMEALSTGHRKFLKKAG